MAVAIVAVTMAVTITEANDYCCSYMATAMAITLAVVVIVTGWLLLQHIRVVTLVRTVL